MGTSGWPEPPFGRVVTAMVSPFTPQGALDIARARELARALVASGSEGLVLGGTTGESPTLSREEKLLLWDEVKQAVPSTKVLAGTSGSDTRASVELTREAAELGADGILATTPSYNKPPQEGLVAHFRAVAEAAGGLPVLLYNIPGRTGVNMLPQTTLELARTDNIVAVKEASGDCEQVARIVHDAPQGFAVYSGDDSLTLPFCALGAVGVISVASHVAGPAIGRMLEAFFSGDVEEAKKLNTRLFPLFKGLFVTTNPIPVKAALRLVGFDCGPMRLPLTDLGPEHTAQLRAILSEIPDLIHLEGSASAQTEPTPVPASAALAG
jgi:4-hydroxy-tetrahydrodipicolinate synthase